MMEPGTEEQVQRNPPFRPLGPRRVLPLAEDQIHPVVRIAHRSRFPLEIPERILFDHEFVLVLAGAGELAFGGESCRYQPHDLLFIPPFFPHRFLGAARQEIEHLAVHFDFSPQIAGMGRDLERRGPYEIRLASPLRIPRRQFAPPGGPLEEALLRLVRDQASIGPLAGLRVTGGMFSVLTQALCAEDGAEDAGQRPDAAPAAQAKNRVRVQRVLAFIQAGLQEPLDAGMLAGAADLSLSRMNAVFRQETGYSPLEYVRRERVALARRLLADPALSVKEIAARTGFEDGFQFSKVFRRIDGLSPTQYRDAALASRPRQAGQDPLSEMDIR